MIIDYRNYGGINNPQVLADTVTGFSHDMSALSPLPHGGQGNLLYSTDDPRSAHGGLIA